MIFIAIGKSEASVIAVDTNIIVRLIVGDDEDQASRALALAARERFYVSFSVLAETEWVLRSRFRQDRATIVAAISMLGELVRLTYEDDDGVRWALARYAEGGELADFLHIAAARGVGRFASFERKLAGRAGTDSPAMIEIPR